MDSDRRSGYGQYYDNVHSSNPRASYASNGPPVQQARTEYASQGYTSNSPNHGRVDSYARGDGGGYGRNSYAQADGARPRMSRDALTDSYQDTSKAEEFGASQGWDVYSDFNNTGPRYASIKTGNDGYQEIPSPTPGNASVKSPLVPLDKNTGPNAPVELVTVPALGAEWKAEELRAMTKKGKREDREYERGKKWKAWWRDDYALCGGWGTRRAIVWTVFAICIATGILLAFLIPRVPKFDYDKDSPLVNSTAPDQDGPKFGSFPATFLFNASLNLEVDTNSNFLPLKFNKLHGEVAELDTGRIIAEGELDGYVVPAKAYTKLLLPLSFNYTAANTSDTTWANIYNACRNKNQFINGTRPGINLSVAITMNIAGLVTRAAASKTMTGVPCPFELSPSAA